jgi:hypothetical protein
VIVRKEWQEVNWIDRPHCTVCGWYFLGFIPLYVRRVYHQTTKRKHARPHPLPPSLAGHRGRPIAKAGMTAS